MTYLKWECVSAAAPLSCITQARAHVYSRRNASQLNQMILYVVNDALFSPLTTQLSHLTVNSIVHVLVSRRWRLVYNWENFPNESKRISELFIHTIHTICLVVMLRKTNLSPHWLQSKRIFNSTSTNFLVRFSCAY